jgi:hypothetical protein
MPPTPPAPPVVAEPPTPPLPPTPTAELLDSLLLAATPVGSGTSSDPQDTAPAAITTHSPAAAPTRHRMARIYHPAGGSRRLSVAPHDVG